MSQQEKPAKISKLLRIKAQEFLSNLNRPQCLEEIVQHFHSGSDTLACLLTLEMVFCNVLKDKVMHLEYVPFKSIDNTNFHYKEWLRNVYENCFTKIVECIGQESQKIQLQGLSSAMNILSYEGKYPLDNKSNLESYVPLHKLRAVLMEIISSRQNKTNMINKYTEYLMYDDILFFTWKVLPFLTAKCNPKEVYMVNYLLLLEKMQTSRNIEAQILCGTDAGAFFNFDEAVIKKSLNKIWHCVMLWEHTPQTHKQLLIILLEKALPHLEKPLLLTDFFMDSLDVGGPVSLLALQGIFTMIQVHNLDYPNIFAKLYSMFEPEIFHTKYKARLFYLSDLFLSSTHLPETLVAAFAKRLARLALVAPSEDVIIICHFVGNLILRHPGLKCLLNNANSGMSNEDPYIMEERDPLKSNAISSSLWELQTLQQHCQPSVATAARFINAPLPSVEWDLGQILDNTGDDIFDKEVKKFSKLIVLQFEKPNGGALSRGEKVLQFWDL
ncbi:unnamed protein product [Brassicogethes aeneus]|uniref:CCAAT-binding factor domain-containing protein n=1 Tax=Brassicogethes aeneus TaxID=1431903 RepID=A0A9P0BG07_BRAAE|nr:unnamed protein product [Brassicogethes aeneus]